MSFSTESVARLMAAFFTGCVFAAIAVDFFFYHRKNNVKKGKRSIVATGSMFGYFCLYFIVIVKRWGVFTVGSALLEGLATWGGVLLVLVGACLNIGGRFTLKSNWANHIKIYDDHTLITQGIYGLIRHPLYASIMLMLFGGSLLYRSYLSAMLTVCIFIPFMAYRARQEEQLLGEQFPQYSAYRQRTGMFLPKIVRRQAHGKV